MPPQTEEGSLKRECCAQVPRPQVLLGCVVSPRKMGFLSLTSGAYLMSGWGVLDLGCSGLHCSGGFLGQQDSVICHASFLYCQWVRM
jgi:hypothetical protein